jgi:hypothetical protein
LNDDEYARLDGKVASLTAALLARKGEASPSLKRFLNARGANPFSGESCAATGDPVETCEKRRQAGKRVSFTLRLPVPDFLRLKLAAGLFERTSQSILLEALRGHLDARAVERFDDCPCLEKAARGVEKSRG